MVVLIVILTIAAVTLGAWAASTSIEARQTTARSIRAVSGYGGGTTVREQEMLETVADRVLTPLVRAVVGLGRRFTPAGYMESLKRRIVFAGNPPGYEVDRFLALKVVAVGAVPLVALVTFAVLDLRGAFGLGFTIAIAAFLFLAPDAVLKRRVDQRRQAIERALPDMLDLLVISVEAGLGFEQALERTASVVPGPLSDEARRMLQETRMGASRSDALRALDERVQVDDLRAFVLAMLQADSFGISISRILKSQADETRTRRRQRAQELAQRAPIKMLFPLATCIFPAIFVVVLLPALLNIADSL